MAKEDEADDDFDEALDDDGLDVTGSEEEEEGDISAHLGKSSRSLAVRRAIEHRMEQRRLDRMLNYLELDFDEED